MNDTSTTPRTPSTPDSALDPTAAGASPAAARPLAQPTATAAEPAAPSSVQQGTTGRIGERSPIAGETTAEHRPDITSEEVGFRPPDHAPSPEAPASENAGLIFERS